MNNSYWKKYYKNKKRQKPSPFFEFCEDKIKNDAIVLDFGAGDGRDTYAIAKKTGAITYVEPNNELDHFCGFNSLEDLFKTKAGVDIIYGRWIIHAISLKEENKLLDYAELCGATLMLEFRTDEDTSADDSHERRLINPYEFQEKLKKKGFIIKEIKIGHGFSKVRDNDPHLCRLIAEYNG